jgi:hypothetical protein
VCNLSVTWYVTWSQEYIHMFWKAPESATPLSSPNRSGTQLWRSTDQGWVIRKYPKLWTFHGAPLNTLFKKWKECVTTTNLPREPTKTHGPGNEGINQRQFKELGFTEEWAEKKTLTVTDCYFWFRPSIYSGKYYSISVSQMSGELVQFMSHLLNLVMFIQIFTH